MPTARRVWRSCSITPDSATPDSGKETPPPPETGLFKEGASVPPTNSDLLYAPAPESEKPPEVQAKKKSADNPLFKEILDSQIAFAKRATRWEQDTLANRRMAVDHYFGPTAAATKL